MELGEGLKLIKDFLHGGNHSLSETKVILNYMVTYLNYAYTVKNLELDRDRIEHAYKSGIIFMKITK